MFYFNTLNLNQISGGNQIKQGDFGSTFTYKLANEKNQELNAFDKKTAYVNLVLDNNIIFTTTVTVDVSTVTFHIDKAIQTGLYFLEIKIDSYIFPSDRQTIILVTAGAVAYDLKDLIPNYDTNMTISSILSDLSKKGIDISDLKTKIDSIKTEYNYINQVKADKTELNKTNEKIWKLEATTSTLDNKVSALSSGAPKVVSLVSSMTDKTKNYVYTGTESGYTSGNWYYWSGSFWVSGGTYQSTGIADKSVTQEKLDNNVNKSIKLSLENSGTYQNLLIGTFKDGYVRPDGTFATTDAKLNYHNYNYECKTGERFKVSGSVVNQYTTLVAFFNGDTFINYLGIGDVGGTYKAFIDFEFSVPTNSDNFYLLNVGVVTLPEVKKLIPIKEISNIVNVVKNDIPLLNKSIGEFKDIEFTKLDHGYYKQDGTFGNVTGSSHTVYYINVTPGEHIRVTGTVQNMYTTLVTLFDINHKAISYLEKGVQNKAPILFENYEFIIPDGCYEISLFNFSTPSLSSPKIQKLSYNNHFKDKKIAWFGTSIPAGGYIGLGNDKSYPMKIGGKLDAKVYNESVGSSPAHCKWTSKITEENPYGFNGNYDNCSRALGNTVEEMQWIIDHWNASFWSNPPKSRPTNIEEILSFSYENKLKKHLSTGSEPVDLFVFDHGYNDQWHIDSFTPDDPYDMLSFQGTMNFFIKMILEDNPRARIIIIGGYENQSVPKISQAQSHLANYWSIPIMPLWEVLGFSNKKITTTGFWKNGIWQKKGGISQEISIINTYLADGIHPHSDLSGKTTEYITQQLVIWLKSNIRFY